MERPAMITRPNPRTIIIALLAGFAVLLLLFPASGVGTLPPECYSMFGYAVPCEAWVAWAGAALAAAAAGVAIRMIGHRDS